MEKLQNSVLTSVLDVITAANVTADINDLINKIIDVFCSAISSEGVVFSLPHPHRLLGDIILKNLDEKYLRLYREHYYQFDPISLGQLERGVFLFDSFEDVINYEYCPSTEYYNDFLKPQKIHYKLIVNLQIDGNLEGTLVLTRSKNSEPFDSMDVQTAKHISPYLAHCLCHHRLKMKAQLIEHIADSLGSETSKGMLLLDEKFRILYVNKKVSQFLNALSPSESVSIRRRIYDSSLLEDCRKMGCQADVGAAANMGLPRLRVVSDRDQKRFCIRSKTICPAKPWRGEHLYMITVEELPASSSSKWKFLSDHFKLSPREVDVVSHLFTGMKNSEIAEKLFVSEVTVKKHLQNIYAKIGVKNRTSLFSKIFSLNFVTTLPV